MSYRYYPLILSGMLVAANAAHGAGFALIEQNASGMGNAYAGAAAVAEDASTIYFNPAGLSNLHGTQVVVAGHAIKPSADFSNSGSATPLRHPLAGGGSFPLGGDGGDAGDLAVVPNLYFSTPLSHGFTIGVGINAPFGLATEYDKDWIGRYQAIKSDLKTINVNPTLAYQVNDQVSIGIGANWQRLEVELTNAANLVTQQGRAKLEGDDHAWGWNAGALVQITPSTRIGASFRSKINYDLTGDVRVTNAAGAAVVANPIRASVTMPDSYSLSLAHQLNDQWEILADYTHTSWDEIQTIRIINANTGAQQNALNLLFDNSYRVSLGANYKYSDQLKLRFGVAYDESPVKDSTRTARLPDNDRTWVSFGASYKITASGTVDAGYTHIFVKDGDIRDMRGTALSAASAGNLVGDYENDVNILSIQYTHNF